MKTVNMHEAKTHLSRLVEGVEKVEPFIIARAGKPVVKVTLVEQPAPRRLGFMQGQFEVPDARRVFTTFEQPDLKSVFTFRVVAPERAIIEVEDFSQATSQLAQTTLRSVLGKHDLDELLSERDKLNNDIQSILDRQNDHWGIKVSNVEIKDIDIGESMIRVIARQAEAERERRAKVISAEGEQQAAHKLLEAAEVLAKAPEAMQLRYLGTLAQIGQTNNSTIVFPFPVDLAKALGQWQAAASRPESAPPPGSS